jgi:hypothetical protein
MPQAPSLARDFFDRITTAADPVAAIQALVNSSPPTFETDWLDFKTEDADPKKRDKGIRNAWYEALSGFANNSGGVLIWGLDARKMPTPSGDIDAVFADKPITAPMVLKSRLTELQRGATDQPLANVKIEAYELSAAPGTGYVVCYIPEGPFKPYQAQDSCKQYYLRAGDNTVVMSRRIQASLFYPRLKPRFKVKALLEYRLAAPRTTADPQHAPVAEMNLIITLLNTGTATAKDVSVRVAGIAVRYNLRGDNDAWKITTSRIAIAERSLHPDDESGKLGIVWAAEVTLSKSTGFYVLNSPDVSVTTDICCEDQQRQCIPLTFKVTSTITHEGGRISTEADAADENS